MADLPVDPSCDKAEADESETDSPDILEDPLIPQCPLMSPRELQQHDSEPPGVNGTSCSPPITCEADSVETQDVSRESDTGLNQEQKHPEESSTTANPAQDARDAPTIPISSVPVSTGINAAIYVLGHVVLCAKPAPLAPYHTRGWHEPEEAFTWIDGVEGVLEMLLRRPLSACRLDLQVVPHLVADRLQTLEVYFNFFRLGRFEVPCPATLSIELPSELFILQKTRISLHCPDAVRPSEFGSSDRRRLGIAVAQWCIRCA